MNERIRELLKQAEERYPRHLTVAVPEVVLRQDALEKFAELIIRECCSIADDWVNNYNDGENYPSERIKEHFGVKE